MEDYNKISPQEKAFKILYDEYKNRLYGYILAIVHSTHAAEEITQELFIKLWVNREMLERIINPEHYIFTMARNRTLNYIRKAANDTRLLQELQNAMIPAVNDVEEQITIHDYDDMVEEALKHLSPQRSLVFRLSRYQGLKPEEIAQQLHLSCNTVKNHLTAALRFIRTYLIKRGVTLFWISLILLK
jgi:RNA polymerase sigma-70 factor (ECF subfamily)